MAARDRSGRTPFARPHVEVFDLYWNGFLRSSQAPPDPPDTSTGTVSVNVSTARVGHEGKLAVPVTGMPGAWIISNQTITPSGRVFVLPDVAACNTGTQQQCNRFLATQHLRRRITYQAASRFWAFQAIAVRLPDPAKPISGGRPRSWWAPLTGDIRG